MECVGTEIKEGIMNILITGNMGYVGSKLVKYLKKKYPYAKLIGYDIGYFKDCLTNTQIYPESLIDYQYYGDIRKIDERVLSNLDSIVHLAAISNDPIGNEYEEVTENVNFRSSIQLAKMAARLDVKSFVFASSCSVYGNGTTNGRIENCEINPLTAYAKSKVNTENEIKTFANKNFRITSLRFSTACGMSDRLRLDLVLNDFIANATSNKQIQILSDGTPWRPLIHIEDMSRAIDWAIHRNYEEGGDYLAVNVGKNDNNFQIRDLAFAVKEFFPNINVKLNSNAQPDNRSYRVNFDLFNSLAPKFQPIKSLEETINEIKNSLVNMKFHDKNFRESELIRLQKLKNLREQNKLNNNLEWIN